MPRGPLPSPTRRRRNAAAIPTTLLPAAGHKGRPPALPSWVELARAGRAWWRFAWRTPQAAGWGPSFAPVVARRAGLEDDFASAPDLKTRLALAKELRELDDRLGLTPKGMAALRWRIVDERKTDPAAVDELSRQREERRHRLVAEQ